MKIFFSKLSSPVKLCVAFIHQLECLKTNVADDVGLQSLMLSIYASVKTEIKKLGLFTFIHIHFGQIGQ
jgi:hypothetical protein